MTTKILLIDDEQPLLEEVAENLSFEGFEVISTSDGSDGVGLAQQEHPDLIVCDIMMPQLDGYGVLLELRSNPTTADIPFIFLTAKAGRDDFRRGMNLGADDFLVKPFSHDDLAQAIRTRLEKKAVIESTHRQQIKTLRAMLDEQHENLMLKSKFVAMASHEFRTPLSTIMASNSLIRDYGHRMSEEQKIAHMARIEASVRLLIQLLDEMLLVGDMESGRVNCSPVYFDLSEYCRELIDELQQTQGAAHELVFDSHHAGETLTDPKLIRQIVMNLLSNAIKYSPNTRITLTVVQSHQGILLTVNDQGIGIPEADRENIYKAFHRASNVGDTEGTGLGLAIVKQAVDLLNGTITIESEMGVGTTFTVLLPIRRM